MILSYILAIACTLFFSKPLASLVREHISTAGLTDERARRLAEAAIDGGAFSIIYCLCLLITGVAVALTSFLLVFLVCTLLEYFAPYRK